MLKFQVSNNKIQHEKLNAIQGLRFFAAMAVCIAHLVGLNGVSSRDILDSLEQYANFGVNLFFIISGFIITWLLIRSSKLPSFRQAVSFLIKRVFRIYPLFWIVLICMILIHIVFFSTHISKTEINWQILLLIKIHDPLVPQAWTLPFELYFYFNIFCFMCLFQKRWFVPIMIAWFIIHFMIFITNYYHFLTIHNSLLTSNNIMFFGYGMMVCSLLYKYPPQNSIILILLIILGSIILFASSPFLWRVQYPLTRSLPILGIFEAVIVYGLVGLEKQNKIHMPRFFVKLGDISYSIYLWHFFTHKLLSLISMYLFFYANANIIIKLICELLVLILWSFASYKYIESPMIHLSRKLVKHIR